MKRKKSPSHKDPYGSLAKITYLEGQLQGWQGPWKGLKTNMHKYCYTQY